MSSQPAPAATRENLGLYSSIVCFKAVVTGMEEALGPKAAAIALKAAGRKRGHNLVKSLGGDRPQGLEALGDALRAALGADGTRLCQVDRIEGDVNGVIRVYVRETICSWNEVEGADRECTFTLGALHGAVEEVTGRRLRARQVGSVLRGQSHDIIELSDL